MAEITLGAGQFVSKEAKCENKTDLRIYPIGFYYRQR